MSTFSIFEIGKSALLTARRGMDVAGHNLANAATPGYSRQRVVLEPIIQRGVQVSGAGVKATDIIRIRDRFLDALLRSEQASKESFLVKGEVLDHLQAVLAEPSDTSVRNAVDELWSAWQDLGTDPLSHSARSQVMEMGRSLVDLFVHIGEQMDSLSRDVATGIDAVVGRVNLLCGQVRDLNVEISRALARKEPASDLQDRRDLLLDELAELAGTTALQVGDGDQVRVSLGSFPLVDRDAQYKISLSFEPETVIRWEGNSSETQKVDCLGGKLAGYVDAKDQIVSGFKAKMEELFKDIVDGVNVLHRAGFPKEGEPCDFFVVVDPQDYLHSVTVNPDIVNNPGLICASLDGDPGDGANAYRITDLLGKDSLESGGFVARWTAILGEVGATGQKIEAGYKAGELLVKELENRKDSISGVSVDEEVANLIREQHAFNAASRLITAADEMLDTIISRMGLTGR